MLEFLYETHKSCHPQLCTTVSCDVTTLNASWHTAILFTYSLGGRGGQFADHPREGAILGAQPFVLGFELLQLLQYKLQWSVLAARCFILDGASGKDFLNEFVSELDIIKFDKL